MCVCVVGGRSGCLSCVGAEGRDWESINCLQFPRLYLCTPSRRMNGSCATKSCVLILLLALLCAERGEVESEREGQEGTLETETGLRVVDIPAFHFHYMPSA